MKALLIDHDDSFTYNLRSWLNPIFQEIAVVNHRDFATTPSTQFDLIIISPGPKSPKDYPQTLQQIQKLDPAQKVLGICLGMQMLAHLENILVSPYTPPKHGKKSLLKIQDDTFIKFNGLKVARYHSLACDLLQSQKIFQVIAVSHDDSKPMWIQHSHKNWLGWQFHPESFLTENADLFLQEIKKWCAK